MTDTDVIAGDLDLDGDETLEPGARDERWDGVGSLCGRLGPTAHWPVS